jgi:hypothetical protein
MENHFVMRNFVIETCKLQMTRFLWFERQLQKCTFKQRNSYTLFTDEQIAVQVPFTCHNIFFFSIKIYSVYLIRSGIDCSFYEYILCGAFYWSAVVRIVLICVLLCENIKIYSVLTRTRRILLKIKHIFEIKQTFSLLQLIANTS